MSEVKQIAGMHSSDGAAIAYSPLERTEAQAVDKSQSSKCDCCHCKSKPVALTPEQEAADIKRWAESFNKVFINCGGDQ